MSLYDFDRQTCLRPIRLLKTPDGQVGISISIFDFDGKIGRQTNVFLSGRDCPISSGFFSLEIESTLTKLNVQ